MEMVLNKIILLYMFGILVNANNQLDQVQFCGDFKPQVLVDIDKLIGNWFGIEIILHTRAESELIKYYETCPKLFLSSIPSSLSPVMNRVTTDNWYSGSDQQEPFEPTWDELMQPVWRDWLESQDSLRKSRRKSTLSSTEEFQQFKKIILPKLSLVWTEDNVRLEYSLRYNVSKPGYWMSFGFQNGSMLEYNSYKQFIGTVQVLRAVRSNIVLTFCHISAENQFFSIIMSRESRMSDHQLEGIHHILERKHLPLKHIRRMCVNYSSGTTIRPHLIYLLQIIIVSFFPMFYTMNS